MAGISITKLLIIALIVILFFGTNKLRTLGADLGAAIRGFKKALNDDNNPTSDISATKDADFQQPVLNEQAQPATTTTSETTNSNKEQV